MVRRRSGRRGFGRGRGHWARCGVRRPGHYGWIVAWRCQFDVGGNTGRYRDESGLHAAEFAYRVDT